MRVIPFILAALGVALGIVVIYLANLDDSPGLGGIGLLIIAVSVFLLVRRLIKHDDSTPRVR